MPAYYPENDTPLPNDTEVKSLQKITSLLSDGWVIPPHNDVVMAYANAAFPTKPTTITFKQGATTVYVQLLTYDANGATTRVVQG